MVRLVHKINRHKWDYLLVFLIMFLSDDSYWAGTSGNTVLSLCRYLFVASFPIIFVFLLRLKFDYRIITATFIISLALLNASMFAGGISGGAVMLSATLFAAVVIVKKLPLVRFSRRFCEVIIAMILISVLIQLLIMLHVAPTHASINVAGEEMTVCLGCVFVNSYFGLLQRNACIFREPGIFMVYICLAYLLDIWINRKELSLKRQLFYFIGVLSTMSTAGIIIWVILFIIYSLRQRKLSAQKLIPFVLFGAMAVLLFQNEIIYRNIFSKLEKGTDSLSVLGRVSSVTIPLKMTLESPFFGSGTENFRAEYIRCGQELYHTEVDPQALATNSILNASAVFGLWFGLFVLYGLLKFSRRLAGRNIIGCGLTFFAVLLLFSNESMQYSLILYLLLFYGLMPPRARYMPAEQRLTYRQCVQ